MSLFSALVTSIGCVTACGDDDDNNNGNRGGSAGSSGKAGATSKGGSAGTTSAGSGGKAGTGGTAGSSAGTSAAGTGGSTAGTAGSGGTAGSTAGTTANGGTSGTSAGAAGESGEGGMGGEGGAFGGEGGAFGGEGGESGAAGSSAGTSGASGSAGAGSGGLGGGGSGGAGTGGGGAGSGGAGAGGAGSGGAGTGGGGTGGTGGAGSPNLFFSEYLENTPGNSDALEIYNAGTTSVNLSTCRVVIYNPGASSVAETITLSGTLAADDLYVLCTTNADASCVVNSALDFSGDDPIALECTVGGINTTLDVIGQIGTDPGTFWGTSPLDTNDVSLRRNCSVTIGDRNGADEFSPAAQWANFTAGFMDIGGYSCP